MKYIFIDIDGTLYSTKTNDVPESAIEAIKKARTNGHKVFICTGRSLAESKKFLNLDIDGFVFGAGSLIYVNKQKILNCPIEHDDVERLQTMLEYLNIGYCFEGSAGGYYDENGYKYVLRYFNGHGSNGDQEAKKIAMENAFYSLDYWDKHDSIYKACIYTDTIKDLDKAEKALFDPYILTVTMRDEALQKCAGEITNKNFNKFTAIAKVVEYFKAEIKDTIAIGDSANDLQMVSGSGYGIAMGNASDDLKKIANFVTTDILDDGVYNALLKVGVIE